MDTPRRWLVKQCAIIIIFITGCMSTSAYIMLFITSNRIKMLYFFPITSIQFNGATDCELTISATREEEDPNIFKAPEINYSVVY